MFPYPSGRLHMGHVRNYTIGDVLARFMRMQGYNVLQPMGWDAFGLPAENAAIANGVPPARWTRDNIAYMRRQLRSLGFAIDWTRELATCDPAYYRWNQWLFLRMLERGIAYKRTGVVNWDPVDQTVLANEQVIDGRGWRTGALVEKREIPMYYLRITAYAEELLAALEHLPGWPERVRVMQANWIGRSEGVELAFPYGEDARALLGDADGALQGVHDARRHAFGVTFVAMSAEHPLAMAAAAVNAPARGLRRRNAAAAAPWRPTSPRPRSAAWTPDCTCATRSPASRCRSGWPTTCSWPTARARSWACRRTMSAILQFAQRYGAADPHRGAGRPSGAYERVGAEWQAEFSDYGVLVGFGRIQRPESRVRPSRPSPRRSSARGLGRKRVQWRLRDWGISRQRYWGCPIPLIHCEPLRRGAGAG